MSTATDVTKDKLVADLKVVISDAEELLLATAAQAGEKASAARARITESLKVAKEKLAIVEDIALDKAKAAARATDDYVHDNPWAAVGIGAAVGLVVGMLISRR
jgi:ElaB/YqjD/DUF883 family membrane-anchored ribosome-binding protein